MKASNLELSHRAAQYSMMVFLFIMLILRDVRSSGWLHNCNLLSPCGFFFTFPAISSLPYRATSSVLVLLTNMTNMSPVDGTENMSKL